MSTEMFCSEHLITGLRSTTPFYLAVAETSIDTASVSDGSLHVLQNVTHVRLMQRHVLVKYFQSCRLLGPLGREGNIGGRRAARIDQSPTVYDRSRRDGGGHRVVPGGQGRLGDGGRQLCDVQADFGRRRRQRNEYTE